MNKIELKNLLFLSRLQVNEEDQDKTIEKLQNTFELIDQMNDLDLDKFEPLNNPLELSNVSRTDEETNRNKKEEFLKKSPKSDEDYFVVPKIVEWISKKREITFDKKKFLQKNVEMRETKGRPP